jgi:flagellar biosynthesis chaperone FliJ
MRDRIAAQYSESQESLQAATQKIGELSEQVTELGQEQNPDGEARPSAQL